MSVRKKRPRGKQPFMIPATDEPAPGRCGNRLRNGKFCPNWPMKGRTKCQIHGGKSKAGADHPRFDRGRRSKYMPKKMLERFEAAISDPEFMNLTAEIGLVDARINEFLQQIDEDQGGGRWRDALRHFTAWRTANQARDVPKQLEAIQNLGSVLELGSKNEHLWLQLSQQIELRRRLTESESRRQKDLHQMISIEQALAYAHALAAVVRRHVTDPHTITAISEEFGVLTAGRDSGSAES